MGFRHTVNDRGVESAKLSAYLRGGLAWMQVWEETAEPGALPVLCTRGLSLAQNRHSVNIWTDPRIN